MQLHILEILNDKNAFSPNERITLFHLSFQRHATWMKNKAFSTNLSYIYKDIFICGKTSKKSACVDVARYTFAHT